MRIITWILLGMFSCSWLLAQDTDSTAIPETLPERPTFRSETGDAPQMLQIIFNRGFILNGGSIDTMPLNTFNSGTYSLGVSYQKSFAKNTLGLRVAPSISWLRLAYNQSDAKTFPTLTDSTGIQLDRERHQMTSVDLPISIYVNITKDEDQDPRFFVELGGYVGYLIGANYKARFDNNDIRYTTRLGRLQRLEGQFERFRYGVFGRIGYKWVSLYAMMRLTPVFGEFTNEVIRPKPASGYRNPEIPPIELGISLLL
jgi:hypothetical protein